MAKREKRLALVCLKYCELFEVDDSETNEEAEERVRKQIEKDFGYGVIKHIWITEDINIFEN